MNDDANLIKRLKRRQSKALEELMDVYGSYCYHFAARIIGGYGQKEDIEECVSDVFVDVWNKIHQYDSQRSSLKTWVLILTKYKALDYRRKQQNKLDREHLGEESFIDYHGPVTQSVEGELLNNEKYENLLSGIKNLKELDQKIFLLRYFYYYSIEEICNRFNLTREAVDNRLYRSRKQIKIHFEKYEIL